MRSYFFSADTQEDMLGWVRALSQSAAMETNSSLNRYSTIYYRREVLHSESQAFFSVKSLFALMLSGVAQAIRISHR